MASGPEPPEDRGLGSRPEDVTDRATSDEDAPSEATADQEDRSRLARLVEGARSLRPSVQALLALVFYGSISFVLYALPVITRFTEAYVGKGYNDSQTFIWSLEWWPHAVATGQNPMYTEALWAPTGVSLAWVTTLPGPALLLSPITAAFGALTSLNLLQVLSPPLAGWSAFLVARQATGRFWPSVAGGYFFGFSTYLLNHLIGHPNLTLVFPVGLAVYLVIRRTRGTLGPVAFVASLTGVLILLFSIFMEVFATFVVFGGLALLGALAFGGPRLRPTLLRTTALTALSFVLAVAALTPYILAILKDAPSEPIRGLVKPSIDLLSFVVPREHTLVGGEAFMDFTTTRFSANLAGDGGYLGIPLLLLLAHFAVTQWRRRLTWLLLGSAVVVGVAALGPLLRVAGRPGIPLPWALIEDVPLIHNALPGRFTMYLWLVVAIVVALWLAARPRAWWRWALVVLAAVAIFPNLSGFPYGRDAEIPSFFGDGAYQRYLEPGEIVLVVPFGRLPAYSTDMLWQVETDMYFRLTTGNTGFVPKAHRGRTLQCLRRGRPDRVDPDDFRSFIAERGVEAVVVADGWERGWEHLLPVLGVTPIHVGGVSLYSLPDPGRVGADMVEETEDRVSLQGVGRSC